MYDLQDLIQVQHKRILVPILKGEELLGIEVQNLYRRGIKIK